jgi:hypothetical protein
MALVIRGIGFKPKEMCSFYNVWGAMPAAIARIALFFSKNEM